MTATVYKNHELEMYSETPFTAAAAYTAGDVILVNNIIGVVVADVLTSAVGVLVYKSRRITVPCVANGGGTHYDIGDTVYHDASNEQVTYDSNSGANTACGTTVYAQPGTGATSVMIELTGAPQLDTTPGLVYSVEGSSTRADIETGVTVVAAVAGVTLRVVGYRFLVDGAFDTSAGTSINLQDDNSSPVIVTAMDIAALTTGAVIGSHGIAIANTDDGPGVGTSLTASKGIDLIAIGATLDAGTKITYQVFYKSV